MIARVAAIGNGVAIELNTEVAERFGLAPGAEVEVLVETDRIVVIPKPPRTDQLAAAVDDVLAAHDETLRRLTQR